MGKYDDIINQPHHVSKKHKPMSMEQRAAQFAPFAALSGFSENIDTANRYVTMKAELSDDQQTEIDSLLGILSDNPGMRAYIEHFVPDPVKEGGMYKASEGTVIKLDHFGQHMELDTGEKILFENIHSLRILEEND